MVDNGLLNGIHFVVDGLVHAFDAPGHDYIPADLFRLLLAGELAEFLDELQGFFLCKEPAGLDRGNQQLQFRQLEVPFTDVIAAVFSPIDQNIYAEFLQDGDVGIDGLSVAQDPLLFQHLLQLYGSHRMILVGVFLQIVPNIQDDQPLFIGFCHEYHFLSRFFQPIIA